MSTELVLQELEAIKPAFDISDYVGTKEFETEYKEFLGRAIDRRQNHLKRMYNEDTATWSRVPQKDEIIEIAVNNNPEWLITPKMQEIARYMALDTILKTIVGIDLAEIEGIITDGAIIEKLIPILLDRDYDFRDMVIKNNDYDTIREKCFCEEDEFFGMYLQANKELEDDKKFWVYYERNGPICDMFQVSVDQKLEKDLTKMDKIIRKDIGQEIDKEKEYKFKLFNPHEGDEAGFYSDIEADISYGFFSSVKAALYKELGEESPLAVWYQDQRFYHRSEFRNLVKKILMESNKDLIKQKDDILNSLTKAVINAPTAALWYKSNFGLTAGKENQWLCKNIQLPLSTEKYEKATNYFKEGLELLDSL